MISLGLFAKRLLMISMLSVMCAINVAATQEKVGRFITELDLRDTGNGRDFTLLHDFIYEDPSGVRWIAPESAVVNGASIPRALWSIIGSPWTGPYRRASVIHDYFFTREKYGSDAIHKVFYDAMLTDGVPRRLAKLMYYAVVRFNDKWEVVSIDPYECNFRQQRDSNIRCYPTPHGAPNLVVGRSQKVRVEFSYDELKMIQERLESEDISISELGQIAKENFSRAEKKIVEAENIYSGRD